MTLKVFDAFEAEGEPQELAAFAFVLLEVIHMQDEHERKKAVEKEMELFERFRGMSFEDMMKTETEEDDDE